jgi:ubiquinone/menaquinone biosynthesis C-methylase UbiE
LIPPQSHPYRIFEQTLLRRIKLSDTVLDIGCGRHAPNLVKLKGRANVLIGIDLVRFEIADPDLVLLTGSVCKMSSIATSSIELAYSRSLMEHVEHVEAAYAEIDRVLKPGGTYAFLTPNFFDYASLIGYLVPNRFHAAIVRLTERRSKQDVFPTFYRSNTHRSITRLTERSNLLMDDFAYLGQYPSQFTFSEVLFRLGSRYEKFLERHCSLHCLRGWILCILSKPP